MKETFTSQYLYLNKDGRYQKENLIDRIRPDPIYIKEYQLDFILDIFYDLINLYDMACSTW